MINDIFGVINISNISSIDEVKKITQKHTSKNEKKIHTQTTAIRFNSDEVKNYQSEELLILFYGRCTNKHEIIKNFKLDSKLTLCEIIRFLYKNKILEKAGDLSGEFSIIIFDKIKQKIFVLSDHIANKDIYYNFSQGLFSFSTNISELLKLSHIQKKVNLDRVREYIVFSMQIENETFFSGIYKANKGEIITVDSSSLKVKKYFVLKQEMLSSNLDDEDYAYSLKEIFKKSVIDSLDSEGSPTSIALSGGLDSSSIACTAQKFSSRQLIASSFNFEGLSMHDKKKTDELSYMKEVISTFPTIKHNLIEIRDNGPITYLNKHIKNYDEPISAVNIYTLDAILESAKMHSCNVHLEGFDGDSVISHGYFRLNELGRSFKVFKLLEETRKLRNIQGKKFNVINTLKEYFLFMHMPDWAISFKDFMLGNKSLAKTRLERLSNFNESREWILNKIHLLNDLEKEQLKDPKYAHLKTLQNPIWSNAISAMNKAASIKNMKIRTPFFDQRMVKFCLSLPSNQKLKNGVNRYVFRNAMKNIVPNKIINRYTKSDISPMAKNQLMSFGIDNIFFELNRCELIKEVVSTSFLKDYSYFQKQSESQWLFLYHMLALSRWYRSKFL